jgi:hypothetical protein
MPAAWLRLPGAWIGHFSEGVGLRSTKYHEYLLDLVATVGLRLTLLQYLYTEIQGAGLRPPHSLDSPDYFITCLEAS